MGWVIEALTSSLGRKLVMSLTGLFLVLFLLVHLAGNLQLLLDDGGQQFNLYAAFMSKNPLIKTISIALYLFIILHAVQGMLIWRQNRHARGTRYRVHTTKTTSFAGRNMAGLGVVIFVFILIHMWQFWYKMKFGELEMVTYAGESAAVQNLYAPVEVAFGRWYFVLFYVLSMLVVAFHLDHGIDSAFRTLGLAHKRIFPVVKFLGKVFSWVVPIAFAIIPAYFYFFRA
jgi:succinate dehydrogenase / fumarate reductase cytochrome b subunit